MQPTTRELATILAALRHWQANMASDCRLEEVFAEHFSETTPLTTTEINNLCEKLNYSVRKLSKTHADVELPNTNIRAAMQSEIALGKARSILNERN